MGHLSGITLAMWKAVITRTSDFSFRLVHGSIALSHSYYMAELVGLKLSPNLSSSFPRILQAVESSGGSQCALQLSLHCVLLY